MVLKTLIINLHKDRIIIIDVFSTSAFWFAFWINEIAHFFGISTILVLHGGNLPQRFINTPWACKRLFNNSTRIVSPSNYLKSEVFSKFSKQVSVLPNPINLNKYPIINKEFYAPKILWVRSFHELYNPQLAIFSFVEILKIYPDAKLCMIGPDKDGSLLNCKNIVNELGINDKVIFTGILSKDEWIAKSIDYNIFLNTTNFDNAPVSIIEALALGLPVVSTNVGGIPWLLQNEKTALLVEKGNTYQMTQAVIRIFNEDKLRHLLIQNGRMLVESMDIKEVSKEWKLLIDDVIR